MAFDYRDGAGNCPPGYYRPAAGYDCRPVVSGAVIQQQNLEQVAAHYVDTEPAGSVAAAAPQLEPMPFQFGAPVNATATGGGLDLTTLLLVGLGIFLVMKK